jgi:hypothetical protein
MARESECRGVRASGGEPFPSVLEEEEEGSGFVFVWWRVKSVLIVAPASIRRISRWI